MTKTQILFDICEMEAPLRLVKVALNKGHISAAISFLEDIESEAIRLRIAIQDNLMNEPKPTPVNYLHPNDPAHVPFNHE